MSDFEQLNRLHTPDGCFAKESGQTTQRKSDTTGVRFSYR